LFHFLSLHLIGEGRPRLPQPVIAAHNSNPGVLKLQESNHSEQGSERFEGLIKVDLCLDDPVYVDVEANGVGIVGVAFDEGENDAENLLNELRVDHYQI
jgi:hypothetical protein